MDVVVVLLLLHPAPEW